MIVGHLLVEEEVWKIQFSIS